jgi:hypothetical protein
MLFVLQLIIGLKLKWTVALGRCYWSCADGMGACTYVYSGSPWSCMRHFTQRFTEFWWISPLFCSLEGGTIMWNHRRPCVDDLAQLVLPFLSLSSEKLLKNYHRQVSAWLYLFRSNEIVTCVKKRRRIWQYNMSWVRAPPWVHAKSQMDGHSQCIDYFDDPPVHFKPRIFTRAP